MASNAAHAQSQSKSGPGNDLAGCIQSCQGELLPVQAACMAYCAAKFGIQTGAGKVSGNIPVIGGALKADEALANFAAGFNKTIAYVFQHPWVLIVAIAALFLLIASAKGLVTGS